MYHQVCVFKKKLHLSVWPRLRLLGKLSICSCGLYCGCSGRALCLRKKYEKSTGPISVLSYTDRENLARTLSLFNCWAVLRPLKKYSSRVIISEQNLFSTSETWLLENLKESILNVIYHKHCSSLIVAFGHF